MRTLPLGSLIPVCQDTFHIRWNEAILVHSDRYPINAEGERRIGHGGEGEFLAEEGVTGVAQEPETLGERIGVSEAERDGVLWRCMDTVIQLRERISDVLQARTSAIGHGCSEAQRTRFILVRGDDLLFSGARSPGLDGVLLTDRRHDKIHLADRVQRVVRVTCDMNVGKRAMVSSENIPLPMLMVPGFTWATFHMDLMGFGSLALASADRWRDKSGWRRLDEIAPARSS